MATEFQMPKLGLTMEAGTIKEWLVEDGTEVAPGQAVLLIETDKVDLKNDREAQDELVELIRDYSRKKDEAS